MTAVHRIADPTTDLPAAGSPPARPSVVSARAARLRARRRPAERDLTQIDSLLELSTGLWPWLPGANVIMQLANPGVGYGVLESRVESGRVDRHPIKRGRTTGLYLAVATIGSESDRAFIHDEVKRIHSQVFSTPQSPVRYSGNSQQLQLWVAVCLLRFFVDQYELLYRELTADEREHVLALGMPLATVLNVDPAAWPTSWEAYEEYFRQGMEAARIDDPVREMLDDLVRFGPLSGKLLGLGTALARTVGPVNHSFTRFGVPRRTREEMRWEIRPSDLRRRRVISAVARAADVVVPAPLRVLYTVALWDLRARRALGIAVF